MAKLQQQLPRVKVNLLQTVMDLKINLVQFRIVHFFLTRPVFNLFTKHNTNLHKVRLIINRIKSNTRSHIVVRALT